MYVYVNAFVYVYEIYVYVHVCIDTLYVYLCFAVCLYMYTEGREADCTVAHMQFGGYVHPHAHACE